MKVIIMKKESMLTAAMMELEHIPKGRFPQGIFRGTYYWLRMNSLKTGVGTKKEILAKAIESIKKDYPDFEPTYDKNFFK